MDDDERKGLDDAKKVLLDQAAALGMKVDARWSVDTLAERVLEAQDMAKAAAKAEFAKTTKVKVRLLRDGFPEEDVKVLAGDTCMVTEDIAFRWYDLGVAVPARPND